jgi:hypothetical protein
MTTSNDSAWQRYLSAKEIDFTQPSYTIEADELRELAQREPRLLAKFDTPDQLPQPFRESGYTLLPVRNGRYQLVPGNLFVELAECQTEENFVSDLPFPLITAGRGSGESQYIDQAFNTGLLRKFLNIDEMYQTIRGREYTKHFSFDFLGQHISVESVQIEVDAGYEALHDLILIEAKTGVPASFNIRQLYYPYRHFSALVPQKRVRNVFLAYDIPTASYSLYEFSFLKAHDPLSADMKRCIRYKIAPPEQLTFFDLIDARFQTHNSLVPQADDLNKVFELLMLVEAGFNRAVDVADYFVFDPRQSSYYREAAEYLGLIANSRESGYILTEMGIELLATATDAQRRTLAKVVVNSWIFIALVQRADVQRTFTESDIDNVIMSARNLDGTQHYGGSTVPRRRHTIIAWIRWLAQEIGCFSIDNDMIYRIQ